MASALLEAGLIIAEYLQPVARNAEKTVERLIAVLETPELAATLEHSGPEGRARISGRLEAPRTLSQCRN